MPCLGSSSCGDAGLARDGKRPKLHLGLSCGAERAAKSLKLALFLLLVVLPKINFVKTMIITIKSYVLIETVECDYRDENV